MSKKSVDGAITPELIQRMKSGACSLAAEPETFYVDQFASFDMCRRLASEVGICCGPSTGLNVLAAIDMAKEIGSGRRIVTLGCDNGSKYLAGDFY